MDCIFCKIISGQIPSSKVYEDDRVLAFDDINPMSPVHVLVVPKEHIVNVNDLTVENSDIMAAIFLAAKEVARIKGIDQGGYRIIINNGTSAGQEVWHMHVHIMGGKEYLGPMLAG